MPTPMNQMIWALRTNRETQPIQNKTTRDLNQTVNRSSIEEKRAW